MKKYLTVTVMLVVMLALLTTFTQVAAQEQEMGPDEVIQAVYEAVAAKDVDAAMELVAEDAVLVLIPPPAGLDGTFVGKAEIRDWWEGLAMDNGRAEFSDIAVSGNAATWKAKWWSGFFEGLGVGPAEFEGVNIVQDGLFKSATWVFTDEFLARMAAAEALAANKEIVRHYIKAWEQADLTALDALLAEDFVNHSPPMPPDREGMMEFAAEHRSQFPTGTYSIQNLVAEGDLVFVYGQYQGTHDGEPFMGIPASGAEASFDYTVLLRLEDGQLIERWGTSDSIMGMMLPLGFELVPPQ